MCKKASEQKKSYRVYLSAQSAKVGSLLCENLLDYWQRGQLFTNRHCAGPDAVANDWEVSCLQNCVVLIPTSILVACGVTPCVSHQAVRRFACLVKWRYKKINSCSYRCRRRSCTVSKESYRILCLILHRFQLLHRPAHPYFLLKFFLEHNFCLMLSFDKLQKTRSRS